METMLLLPSALQPKQKRGLLRKEGDNNFVIAFFVATRPKQKATTILLLSPSALPKKKRLTATKKVMAILQSPFLL
jgi:hypothetical protein